MDRVHDGVEAVAYVRQQGEFQNRPRPNLILLDLMMPDVSGGRMFDEMRRHVPKNQSLSCLIGPPRPKLMS